MRHGLFPPLIALFLLSVPFRAVAQEALFEISGPPDFVDLPNHAVAAQQVRINRRALLAPRVSIDLFGATCIATRIHIDRQKAGPTVWTGYLEGSPQDSVILVIRGKAASGFIRRGMETHRIGAGSGKDSRLHLLDLRKLPPEDIGGLPDGGGEPTTHGPLAPGDTVQDLLVV